MAVLPSPRPAAFALSPDATLGALRLRGTRGQVLHGAVLIRNVSGRLVTVILRAAGAGLVLGPLPGGTELIESARIKLRVLRGDHTIFNYVSTLGQLFPDAPLEYRIPWKGQPTPGSYHVLGVIYPQGTAAVKINQAVEFTAAKTTQLEHATPPTAQPLTSSLPGWVWVVLAAGAAVLITLSVAVWKLARRPSRAVA
jgi:hypothetical protein